MHVYNQNQDHPQDAVYIGRGSKWGNPYKISGSMTRKQCIAAYEVFLKGNPILLAAVRKELAGKDLVCWCSPKACHGDVLLRLANTRSIFN